MKRFFSISWAPALLATLSVILLGSITTERFLDIRNFQNLIMQLAVVAILAMGAGLVVLSGEIDLSVGSMVSLLSMVLATLVVKAALPIALAVAIVLAAGLLLGSVNGLLVTYLRVPSFVATLGTLGVFGGIALLFNGGSPITGLGDPVQDLFYGSLFSIPLPLVYMVVLIVALRLFLVRTVPGRSVYAVGGNSVAATLTGLRPNRVRMMAFAVAGLLTGIAAVLFAGRLGGGSPNLGSGLELAAIAAAVVGGISLSGGRGDVLGALLGATTIVIVQNILNLNAVPPTWQSIVQGLIIIAAVIVDAWRGSISLQWLRPLERRHA
jgi:ribose transport system permease protein